MWECIPLLFHFKYSGRQKHNIHEIFPMIFIIINITLCCCLIEKKGVESFYYVIPFDYKCLHWSALRLKWKHVVRCVCINDTPKTNVLVITSMSTNIVLNNIYMVHVMIAYHPSPITHNALFSWILHCWYRFFINITFKLRIIECNANHSWWKNFGT